MTPIIIDFETRSHTDLTRMGTGQYVRDPSTEVICIGYQVEGNTYVQPWPKRIPERVVKAMEDPDTVLVAHNALFERAIWTHVLQWPEVPPELWFCTSNLAGLYNLPQSLGTLTQYLWPQDIDKQKDKRGQELIQMLSKPQSRTGEFREDPDLFQEMYAYCAQDVKTTSLVWSTLPKSPPVERRIQIADIAANELGYAVDREFCHKANNIDRRIQERVVQTCEQLTGLRPTQTVKLRTWLAEHGCELPDMSRQTIEQRLSSGAPDHPTVRKVLESRIAGARGSTYKFDALLRQSSDEFPRVTHHTRYAAGNTARWIARGAQIHNFRSRNLLSYDTLGIKREVLTDTLPKGVDIRNYIGGAVRGAIIASPGHQLALGDYSGMENRILMYLAGEERQLQLIREGLDVYKDLAMQVFGISSPDKVDPWQRQICKHMVLGLGFGMGAYSFYRNLVYLFQVDLNPEICRIIVGDDLDRLVNDYIQQMRKDDMLRRYSANELCPDGSPLTRRVIQGLMTTKHLVSFFRGTFDSMSAWWRLLTESFTDLMASAPGTSIDLSPSCVMYRTRSAVVFQLPSGRPMYYWKPRHRKVPKYQENKTSVTRKQRASPLRGQEFELVYEQATGGVMKLLRGYGARFGANLVQGISRDIMAAAFADLSTTSRWIPIVTVHDEIISETRHQEPGAYAQFILNSAQKRPWSADISLKVDEDLSPCWLSKG